MKKIYFVRHAESEANAAGIMAGSEHDIALTKIGEAQAERAGKDLIGKGIEVIIASPMIRTRQTAEIIANEIGYDKGEIVFNELLVERNFGRYEAALHKNYIKDLRVGNVHESVEDDETIYGRAKELLEYVNSRDEKTILLVSHGSFGRAVKVASKKLDHSHVKTVDSIGNAEVFEFEIEN